MARNKTFPTTAYLLVDQTGGDPALVVETDIEHLPPSTTTVGVYRFDHLARVETVRTLRPARARQAKTAAPMTRKTTGNGRRKRAE